MQAPERKSEGESHIEVDGCGAVPEVDHREEEPAGRGEVSAAAAREWGGLAGAIRECNSSPRRRHQELLRGGSVQFYPNPPRRHPSNKRLTFKRWATGGLLLARPKAWN